MNYQFLFKHNVTVNMVKEKTVTAVVIVHAVPQKAALQDLDARRYRVGPGIGELGRTIVQKVIFNPTRNYINYFLKS